MSRKGLFLLGGGLAVIGLAAAVLASNFDFNAEQELSPVVGVAVPDLTLPSLDGGEPVNLRSEAAAHRVTAVNFFASWCLQCRNEHADLIAAAEAYADRSVRFLGIVFLESAEEARAYLDEAGRGGNTLYLTDPGSRAAIDLGVFGIPETIFLRDGMVVGKLIGETDALTLSSALEEILAGATVEARQVGEYRQNPDQP